MHKRFCCGCRSHIRRRRSFVCGFAHSFSSQHALGHSSLLCAQAIDVAYCAAVTANTETRCLFAKRTFCDCEHTGCPLWVKADISQCNRHVRFTPKSRRSRCKIRKLWAGRDTPLFKQLIGQRLNLRQSTFQNLQSPQITSLPVFVTFSVG
jgi:hypothetical protein